MNAFLKRRLEIKQKKLSSPWITRDLKKLSKRKQRLYEKLWKRRNGKNEKGYKMYKNLLEKLKLQSAKFYFQNVKTILKINRRSWRL